MRAYGTKLLLPSNLIVDYMKKCNKEEILKPKTIRYVFYVSVQV